MLPPERAVRPVAAHRRAHEVLELRQPAAERRILGRRLSPLRRAVDGRQHADPVPSGACDHRVVVAPVIGRMRCALHRAPGEIDPQRPDPSPTQPRELDRAGQRLGGDHPVEGARGIGCPALRLAASAAAAEQDPGGEQAAPRSRSRSSVLQHLAEEPLGALLLRLVDDLLAGCPARRSTPSSMKMTWSATSRAKPISWVTTSIVIPSLASSRITSSTSLTSSGSRALVTSSKSISFGSIASARAIATRCCWPPESRAGYSSTLSASPTRSSSSVARRRASSAAAVRARSAGPGRCSRSRSCAGRG